MVQLASFAVRLFVTGVLGAQQSTVVVVDFTVKHALLADFKCPVTKEMAGQAFVDPESMQVVRMEQKLPKHDVYSGTQGLWAWSIDYAPVVLKQDVLASADDLLEVVRQRSGGESGVVFCGDLPELPSAGDTFDDPAGGRATVTVGASGGPEGETRTSFVASSLADSTGLLMD